MVSRTPMCYVQCWLDLLRSIFKTLHSGQFFHFAPTSCCCFYMHGEMQGPIKSRLQELCMIIQDPPNMWSWNSFDASHQSIRSTPYVIPDQWSRNMALFFFLSIFLGAHQGGYSISRGFQRGNMRLYVRNNSLLFRSIYRPSVLWIWWNGGQGQLLCLFLCIIGTCSAATPDVDVTTLHT